MVEVRRKAIRRHELQCFFPGCTHTHDTYLGLMGHMKRIHKQYQKAFAGTHFHRKFPGETNIGQGKTRTKIKASIGKQNTQVAHAQLGHPPAGEEAAAPRKRKANNSGAENPTKK